MTEILITTEALRERGDVCFSCGVWFETPGNGSPRTCRSCELPTDDFGDVKLSARELRTKLAIAKSLRSDGIINQEVVDRVHVELARAECAPDFDFADVYRYRIERQAEEEWFWRPIKNIFRRLLFLPVTKTADQAKAAELAKFGL